MPVPIVPLVAAGASLVGSWLSNRSQNKNADKQIAASREENEKARAHNLMLAELQNKWNVEQWAKENEYNSPSAQMARYAAAGLNPNLIYGQSNTSAQLSGSLSSGAPASPADMSAYGRKGSAVGKALENLDPLMFEQLRGMKLKNDEQQYLNEIRANEVYDSNYNRSVREFVRGLNFREESLDSLLNFGAGNDGQFPEGSLYNNPDVRKYLMEYYEIHNRWKISTETRDALIDRAIAESNLAEQELEQFRRTMESAIQAVNANNASQTEAILRLQRFSGVSKDVISILKTLYDIAK